MDDRISVFFGKKTSLTNKSFIFFNLPFKIPSSIMNAVNRLSYQSLEQSCPKLFSLMGKMNKYPVSIIDDLAPCGLSCSKCLNKKDGEIATTAKRLATLLGDNFASYAEIFSSFMPGFKQYPSFRNLLDHMANAACDGCRNGKGCYPDCVPSSCTKEKGYSFCFECPEFPCNRTRFDKDLSDRWIYMNERMKEIGPEAYHSETKDKCRYV